MAEMAIDREQADMYMDRLRMLLLINLRLVSYSRAWVYVGGNRQRENKQASDCTVDGREF